MSGGDDCLLVFRLCSLPVDEHVEHVSGGEALLDLNKFLVKLLMLLLLSGTWLRPTWHVLLLPAMLLAVTLDALLPPSTGR